MIMLFILGACLGSFLCCQARRLHLKSTKHHVRNKRSICLHCRKRLKWYDNLPIISWLLLKGKCRNCRKPIGVAEFLSELLVGIAFLAIGTTINIETASISEWLIFTVTILLTTILSFLAIYDGLYGQLPVSFLIISVIISIILAVLKVWFTISTEGFSVIALLNPFLSALIIGGAYFFLYKVSHGKWVGDGDWILCVAIGFGLSRPFLSLIAIFFANLIASIVMFPVVRKTKNHRIYFGPFLVISFVIVTAISKYTTLLLGI